MSMRDYIAINNYKGNGAIGISRNAIAHIASYAAKEISGADVVGHRVHLDPALKPIFSLLPSGVKVTFTKDGKAVIRLDVVLNKGCNVTATCEAVQERVATVIGLMCDLVPFDIRIKVARIV